MPIAATMDPILTRLRERILAANGAKSALHLRGGGTKDFYGEAIVGDVLDTRAYAGIINYESSELVISARCGTALAEIEAVLAASGQFLPFEPPAFAGEATIGGVVAAGLSGPRRVAVGAARDFVLGATLLDARGELLHFGGQVMKNVAGFDVSRLLCGSLGIFGLITEVSLKVLPRPRAEQTLRFDCSAAEALDRFNRWRAQPLPISATAWLDQTAFVRLSGAASAVTAARALLGGEVLEGAAASAWWQALRNQTSDYFRPRTAARLWRLSVPATSAFDRSGGELIEWSGALRWLWSDAPAAKIRERAEQLGGTAALWRGERDTSMFHPLAKINRQLHQRLKAHFDPHDIFNRGRLFSTDCAKAV
jgi:glycolate oxidase FAD binding subunit